MFRDTKEELRRLEEQLREEDLEEPAAGPVEDDTLIFDRLLEDPEDSVPYFREDDGDFGDDTPDIYKNYSNNYGQPAPEQGERLTGLIVTVAVLLAAIGGVIAWWLFRFFL